MKNIIFSVVLVLMSTMAFAQGSVAASYGSNATLSLCGDFAEIRDIDLDICADFQPDVSTDMGVDDTGVSAGLQVGKRFSSRIGAGLGLSLGNTIDGRLDTGFGDEIGFWDVLVQPFVNIYLDTNSGLTLRGDYRALSEGLTNQLSFGVGVFTGW